MNLILPAVALGAWYMFSLKKTGEKLQRCEISSFKLGKLSIGIKETTIPVVLQVFNPNSTPVPADYFRGIVKRAGLKIADFTFDSMGKDVQLKPRQDTPITFNVRITTVGTIRNIIDIFSNLFAARPIDTVFTIDGVLALGGFDIPVKYSWDAKANKAVSQVSGIGKPYAKMEFSSNSEMEEYFKGGCKQKIPKFSDN